MRAPALGERTPSGVVSWTAAGKVRRSERMKKLLSEVAVELGKRDRGVQMNRRKIQESEQMISTEGRDVLEF